MGNINQSFADLSISDLNVPTSAIPPSRPEKGEAPTNGRGLSITVNVLN